MFTFEMKFLKTMTIKDDFRISEFYELQNERRNFQLHVIQQIPKKKPLFSFLLIFSFCTKNLLEIASATTVGKVRDSIR